MKKRLVATTSTSCLDYINHDYDIRTIRIMIDINGELKADGSEIHAADFYELINNDKKLLPKTSQPSIGSLVSFLEGIKEEGYEELIVTTISSHLSGTINAITQAASMVDDLDVVVFDTRTVCLNEGKFALKAAEMIKNDIPTEDIIKELEHMRDNNKIFFAVGNLSYLVKNGRLSGASGFIGNLLQIKPILELFPDGTIQATEKIRTTKKALDRCCEKFNEYVKGHNYEVNILVTSNAMLDYLENSLDKISGLQNVKKSYCSPVVGCHVGGEAIGLGVFLLD